jgi:hypothetical protein
MTAHQSVHMKTLALLFSICTAMCGQCPGPRILNFMLENFQGHDPLQLGANPHYYKFISSNHDTSRVMQDSIT